MTTSRISIDDVWARLGSCVGAELETKTGKPFTLGALGSVT